jgi:hypothetical protein
VYVLYGCVNIGTYPIYSISEGVVFYNGEIFYVDATGYTSVGADVAVWSMATTQYTTFADPTTLTGSIVVNIHNIRKLRTTSAVVGSGLADYSASNFFNFIIPAQLNLSASGLSSISGVYPNLSVDTATPAAPFPRLLWLGRVTSGGAVITPLYTAPGVAVSAVSHPFTGHYGVTHNIGHTNYYVRGVGIGAHLYGLKTIDAITSTTFIARFADDDTANDTDFELDIWQYQ